MIERAFTLNDVQVTFIANHSGGATHGWAEGAHKLRSIEVRDVFEPLWQYATCLYEGMGKW